MENTKEKYTKLMKEHSFWRYMWDYKGSLLAYIILNATFYVSFVIATIIFAKALNYITELNTEKMLEYLTYGILVLFLGKVSDFFATLIQAKTTRKITTKLRKDLELRLFKISSKSYHSTSSGSISNKLVLSPDTIITSFEAAVQSFGSSISAIVILFYIALMNIYLGLCLTILFGLLILVDYYRLKNLRKNQRIQNKAQDELNAHMVEVVHSEKDVKTLNLENSLTPLSNKAFTNLAYSRSRKTTRNEFFWLLKHFVSLAGILVTLILATNLFDNGFIALSALLFIFMNKDNIANCSYNIGNFLLHLSSISVENSRMMELFSEDKFELEKFGNKNFKEQFSGAIKFDNVYFTYKDEKEGEQVLDGINFNINPKESVAFVGKSGAGKSTILSLILKLYDAESGDVYLDDMNIRELSKEALRENISLVNQFPYIFNSSIRDNLLLVNKDATENELYNAIEKANLKEFVEKLPNKIDTVVGENGIKLSGGQKQRLAIARVFLKNSKVIIFDESTSSLDNFSQEEIRKSIKLLGEDRTVIIVAHRLSTIKDVDRIFFLENGKIKNSGTFNELFENDEEFNAMFTVENLGQ